MTAGFQAGAVLAMAALLGRGDAWSAESAAGASDAQVQADPYSAWVFAHPGMDTATAVAWVICTASAKAPAATPFAGDAHDRTEYLDACAWIAGHRPPAQAGAMSPVILQLQQMVCSANLAEGQRFFSARALGSLSDDAQSIELVIDAATDLHQSPAFRAAIRQQVVFAAYTSILTRAQRKRLESITLTSP